jgi:predicted nuclease with RNAse H fold
MTTPSLLKIKSGWLAKAGGWAVEGPTKEAAMRAYRAAERRHREIDARPMPAHLTPMKELAERDRGK